MSRAAPEGSAPASADISAGGVTRKSATFLPPGKVLGDYTIMARLGAGGMGEVYEAVDTRNRETVALKVLKRWEPAQQIRFKREFRVLAQLRHENLVRPRELVATDDCFFFTMDLCDGPNLVGHVRHEVEPGQLPNLIRLRRSLRQLVAGVSALHSAGLLHRDLKPSNVLVTSYGLVRVLDFGLVRDVAASDDITMEGQLLGTPAYMSPEQSMATPSTPATDWYAVGTMLFELLTGERPFRGTLLQILSAKSEGPPPDPRAVVASVPADLASLTMSLLAVDPTQRPGAAEILEVLGVDPEHDPVALELTHQPLVGRQAEFSALRAAYDRVRLNGQSVTIHLRAESGMGKSKLISEFLAAPLSTSTPFILRGRCFERESVPYKGLDGVIDSLSSQLRHLSELEVAAILPRDVTSLSLLFPVLAQIPAVSNQRKRAATGLDPQEMRQRGVAALRELFGRLGDRHPLIVIIDDFQWADPDSARLLNELMSEPDGPLLMLIVAFRPETDKRAALLTLGSALATSGRDIETIDLGPLRDEDVQSLMNHLLDGANEKLLAQALASANGNPFHIGELVRGGEPEHSSTQLDELVARRVRRLESSSRRLLEIIAVAAGPIRIDQVSQVEGGESDARIRQILGELHRDGMIQLDEAEWVECAHDRIRETVVSDLAPSRLREQHLQLGEVIERGGGEFEVLLEHFEQGGDDVKAANYAAKAAAVAYETFAFDRAVELLRRSLSLDSSPGLHESSHRRRLLADALNDVGRGKEAAHLWLAIAKETTPEEGRSFKRRAADSLIKTGHVEDGLDVLASILDDFGLALPRGRAGALTSLVWERGRSAVRGRRFHARPAARIPPEQLEKIDLCFAVVCGLSTQEVLVGALFQARNLRLALDAGEPYRIARALAYQAVVSVHLGGRWVDSLRDWNQAKALAQKIEDPKLEGYVDLCESSAHWLERRWSDSATGFLDLIERLEGIPDSSWERSTAEEFLNWALIQRGDFAQARARLVPGLQRAQDCGDLQLSIDFSAMLAIVELVSGNLEEAQATLDRATDGWSPDRYLFSHVWLFYATAPLALAKGDLEGALELCRKTVEAMGPASLDQLAFIRDSVKEIEARTYLLAALAGDKKRAGLAKVRARELRKTCNPVLEAHAEVIEAGLAIVSRDTESALERWARAEATFAEYGMEAHCASIRVQVSRVSSGESTHETPEYFQRAKIREPQRVANLLVPALGLSS